MEIKLCPACQKVHPEGTTCTSCQSPLSLVDQGFFIGKSFGRYEITDILGMGGMGIVYRALHTALKREAAVKILLPALSDENFLMRFEREARILAELKHPNIIEVYDSDVSDWGTPYYVMEYLTGRTLREEIKSFPSGLPIPLFREYASQIISALAYAHRKGVIHRDLKPENIFLNLYDEHCVIKILDFGIAKIIASDSDSTSLTVSGTVMGTPKYLAPEQILNQEVGAFTDQYSLALICMEMLTGKATREDKTLGDILAKDIRYPLSPDEAPLLDMDEQFHEPIFRATQPDPADRYPDVRQFGMALSIVDSALHGTSSHNISIETTPTISVPTHPSIPPQAEKQAEPVRRRWFLPSLAVLAVLILLIAVIIMKFSSGRENAGVRKSEPYEKIAVISIPPDASAIVGEEAGSMVLKGAGSIYLLDSDSPATPGRIGLQAGEKLIRALSDERTVLISGERLIARSFKENQDDLITDHLPPLDQAWISPSASHVAFRKDQQITLYGVQEGKLTQLYSQEIPAGEILRGFQIGDYYWVSIHSDLIYVHRLDDGSSILETPFHERRVNAIAMQEQAGLLAVGGWFDDIYLYDLDRGKESVTLHDPGQTVHLAFIPDFPTLLITKQQQLSLWRPEKGIIFSHSAPEGNLVSSALLQDGIVTLDNRARQLIIFSYRNFPLNPPIRCGSRPIWALKSTEDGACLFAGGEDGVLYRYLLESHELTEHKLHTLGLTSMAFLNDSLTTSSDDKTIAVWEVPGMNITWRSKAHDYLINQLYITKNPDMLWSTSSDGTVKKWRWPQLEEVDTIKTGKVSNAAFWINEDETLALVGTWNHQFLVLKKSGGKWNVAERHDTRSQATYSIAVIPSAKLACITGTNPSVIYVYDLETGRFGHLDGLGQSNTWVTRYGTSSFLLSGMNSLTKIDLFPGDPLTYEQSVAFHTDLDILPIAAEITGTGKVATGNEKGEVFLIDVESIPFTPVHRGTLRP